MFLTNPTVAELQLLDLPVLVDMLAKQTADYVQLVSEEGFSPKSAAAKEVLQNIQAAIERKKSVVAANYEAGSMLTAPANEKIQGIQKIS